MILKKDLLAKALSDFVAKEGRGAYADLSKRSGVASPTIWRIANGKVFPKMETWEKLRRAAPEIIPEVSFTDDLTKKKGTAIAGETEDQKKLEEMNEMRIASLLIDTENVLRSESPFADALAKNIDAFKVGIKLWREAKSGHPLKIRPEGDP